MMNLKKYIIRSINSLCIGVCSILAFSCSDEPGDSPYVGKTANSTTLIYAVATNSLSSNLVSDKREMLLAASEIDLTKNNILIFQTCYKDVNKNSADINLVKLVKDREGNYDWEVVKEYSGDIDPLDTSVISEVLRYVADNYPAHNNGLVFWSHSTGSQPYFGQGNRSRDGLAYSFGQDLTASQDENIQINVELLANAVPNDFYDYIWFDSCYMSNIETIYEFRNKCKTFVGYPTEVLANGLPYDHVLPYMVGENPDLTLAAKKFFDYYSTSIATIAVVDMTKIEDFAQACSSIFNEGYSVSPYGFMNYTRYTTGPFYDLGDYAKAISSASENELTDEYWNSLLDKIVIYKAATPRDFAGNTIYPERYSGVSAHVYSFNDDSLTEEYYRNLDWFKDVFSL